MSEKEIINEIDANTCEWRTGIEHCGDYECMINKCCDLNCDWYRRRKLEQLLKAKEQECEELINQRDKFEFGNNILEHERNNYKHVLDEIEHQVTELFLGVENKDRTYCEKILDIINSVKDKNVPHKAKDGE